MVFVDGSNRRSGCSGGTVKGRGAGPRPSQAVQSIAWQPLGQLSHRTQPDVARRRHAQLLAGAAAARAVAGHGAARRRRHHRGRHSSRGWRHHRLSRSSWGCGAVGAPRGRRPSDELPSNDVSHGAVGPRRRGLRRRGGAWRRRARLAAPAVAVVAAFRRVGRGLGCKRGGGGGQPAVQPRLAGPASARRGVGRSTQQGEGRWQQSPQADRDNPADGREGIPQCPCTTALPQAFERAGGRAHLEPRTPLSSSIRRWKVGLASSQLSSSGGGARALPSGAGGT